jgi:succinate dehydrogenase membrane anchor subunit
MAMVANIMSLTGKGLRDWMIQRVTAVIIGLYFVFILGFIILHPDISYGQWKGFFLQSYVRISTTIALIALILHAWIGVWTVITDYVKGTASRLIVQVLVILALLYCFVWGLEILWSR